MVTMTLSSGAKTNLILDPQPGVYGYETNPPLSLTEGELVNCYCPFCWESLQSENYPNFVRLTMMQGNEEKTVLFSRLVGQHKTYVVNQEFTEEYGEQSADILESA